MSLGNVFQISSQAMTAQRERLESAVANLANANTTRTTATGKAYQRRDVIFQTVNIEKPSDEKLFSISSDENNTENNLLGVKAYSHTSELTGNNRQYNPSHPDANEDGYVILPDVNSLEETVNIISASRAFEASATAFNTAKDLIKTVLKLGAE